MSRRTKSGPRRFFGNLGAVKKVRNLIAAPFQSRGFGKADASRKPFTAIRPVRPGDADFVCRLSAVVFRPYGDYGELLRDWLESGQALTVVAHRRDRPVGFAMCTRSSSPSAVGHEAELLAIGVEPRYQRSGVGRVLLRYIEKDCRKQGALVLALHTAVENHSARSLFSSSGFSPVRLKRSFYPRGQSAVLMVKVL